MKISQGLTLILISLIGMTTFLLMGWKDYLTIFYMIVGFGLFRLNDYWGESNIKTERTLKVKLRK